MLRICKCIAGHSLIARYVLPLSGRWKQGQSSNEDYGRRSNAQVDVRPSFIRRATDVAISVACLGVPYIFADRSRSRRDYESGMRSTAGSMLVVGTLPVDPLHIRELIPCFPVRCCRLYDSKS